MLIPTLNILQKECLDVNFNFKKADFLRYVAFI
jgi:hypothetical protein